MARKRIYDEGRAFPFNVRVHPGHKGKVKQLAARLGVNETEAKRLVIDVGLKVLSGAA